MRTYLGVCPHCEGENLTYGAIELEGDQCFYPRECEDCGTTGEEWYNMDFIGHENVSIHDAMEEKIRKLLDEFNDEVYNHDEMRQVERHNEGNGNHHYEFCCYKILRDGNLSPTKYEFQEREYIYSDEEMVKRLEKPFILNQNEKGD